MTAQATRPVGVDELHRAWLAVQAGDFRHPAAKQRAVAPASLAAAVEWTPAADELVIPVVGAAGSCGATMVALALATSVEGPARVVECASASLSGLAAASTAELGADGHGWVHGTRDHVQLCRADGFRSTPDTVPTPSATDVPVVTVVDFGSQLAQVLAGHGWLTSLLADAPTVVVVARATVPGLRRLESSLHLLDADRAVAAVLGPPHRRWPRPVANTVGGLTRAAIDSGRLVEIPEDRTLAVHGLTPDPLPARLVTAGGVLLSHLEGNPHAH